MSNSQIISFIGFIFVLAKYFNQIALRPFPLPLGEKKYPINKEVKCRLCFYIKYVQLGIIKYDRLYLLFNAALLLLIKFEIEFYSQLRLR